jgi:hypothetical protein
MQVLFIVYVTINKIWVIMDYKFMKIVQNYNEKI